MSNRVTPLADIDRRMPEAGRIRLGVKTGKAMKSIETFRFTSPYKDLIVALAEQFGGTPKPWSDPRASNPNQFEVITTSNEMDVILPRGSLSVWYEMWSGGGVQRRCDGEECQVPTTTRDGWEMTTTPCLCAAKGVMECRPYTRLNVIIPSVDFRGAWRLETKGWNAAAEMPGMAELIEQMTAQSNIVRARLTVEKRVQQTVAGKRNFVVPVLSIAATADQMLSGGAAAQALHTGPRPPELARVPEAAPSPHANERDTEDHDEIVDAEVVSDEEVAVFDCARQYGVDGSRLWRAIQATAHNDPARDPLPRMQAAIAQMRSGAMQPVGFNADGSVVWQVATS